MQQFDRVFREHSGFVRRALLRMGVREADVPDSLQEVFVVVLRRLDDFQGRSSIRTWLYGICLRVAAAQRRRTRRREALFSLKSAEAALAPRQDELLSVSEHLGLLERSLARLSAEQRRVFVGFELEERPMAELAAELACPLKTAFSRLHTARKHVNASLARSTGASLAWAAPDALPKLASLPSTPHQPGWLGLGKPGALVMSAALSVAASAGLFVPPDGLALSQTAERGETARWTAARFAQPARATPAAERDAPPEASERTERAAAAPSEPVEELPDVHLEVINQELPAVSLAFRRVALSEVEPIYWVRPGR